MSEEHEPAMTEQDRRMRPQTIITLVILTIFLALAAWKIAGTTAPSLTADGIAATSDTSGRPSMVRDDPVAAYDAALKAGKPVYVLFHSLTCDPCVEISAIVDGVVPEYEGRVTFVNAITDDPGGRALSQKFAFQYIPTSVFVASDGTVVDSFTGVLSAGDMRTRLDALIAP